MLSLIVAGFVLWDVLGSYSVFDPGIGKLKPKPITTVADPISGLQVSPDLAKKRPVAIVIENYPDARPQSGLNNADLVIETFAEGGITRFLAIFQENDYKEIGPVRSMRPYFIDWAASYKALFGHVGGSLDATRMINSSSVYDLDQFNYGSYFWRDNTRLAPHNVYTTIAKLTSAAGSKNYPTTEDNVPAFSFKTEAQAKDRPADFNVNVNFNYDYAVTWNYRSKDNYFYRVMSGKPQTDRISGDQVRAKNLLVGFSDFSYGVNDDGKEMVNIRSTGSGPADIYIDGQKFSGTWQRSSGNILRFYDGNGIEVKLNPGTTWVDFVPTGTVVN